MSERIQATQVGAPDPEMKNSPIIDESGDNEQDGSDIDSVDFAQCHFNGNAYDNGALVCSGDELLKCEHGKWLRSGSCDQDNP